MATFTNKLRLIKQDTAENKDVWGQVLNESMIELTDDAIAGRAIIDVTAGNVTLDAFFGTADNSRPMILQITGTPGTQRQVIVPSTQKLYIIRNGSDGQTSIKTLLNAGTNMDPGETLAMYIDESRDQTFAIQLGGGSGTIAPPAPSPVQFVPATWLGGVSGFTNPNVGYVTQGNISTINLPLSVTGVSISRTDFVLEPDTAPFPVVPTRNHDVYLVVLENNVDIQSYARVRNDGSGIEIFKHSGATWIANSFRKLQTSASGPWIQFSTALPPTP